MSGLSGGAHFGFGKGMGGLIGGVLKDQYNNTAMAFRSELPVKGESHSKKSACDVIKMRDYPSLFFGFSFSTPPLLIPQFKKSEFFLWTSFVFHWYIILNYS